MQQLAAKRGFGFHLMKVMREESRNIHGYLVHLEFGNAAGQRADSVGHFPPHS
jgi:hypothetical protein